MLEALVFSAGMVVAGPSMPVNGDIFGTDDFRTQEIRRARGEDDWPFVASSGLLMCSFTLHLRTVFFAPKEKDGEHGYPFAISADLAQMALSNVGQTGVLRPYDDFEDLLNRLVPYVTMGNRLCDQPAGTVLPDSAL